MLKTFDRGVSLTVLARARTQADHHQDLGCSIQGPASQQVRSALEPLRHALLKLPANEGLKQAAQAIAWLESTRAYQSLCTTEHRLGRRVLKDEVIFPDVRTTPPAVLHVRKGELGFDLRITARKLAGIADAVATVARGATPTELRTRAFAPLLGPLKEAKWLRTAKPPTLSSGLFFVGHTTTVFATATTRVLLDPYFRPSQRIDMPTYQPAHAADLGPIDAVAITHSHGDHFHLGSLLTLPRHTRIFVPLVERESLFSTDCVLRLKALGFTRVEALRWWESRQVGDVTVQALPFYGEQPTDAPGPQANGGLFNVGNTYVLRAADRSAAFFADAGDDFRGSMRDVCRRVRKDGAVDVLFTGIRGFTLAPLHFVFSTLSPFLVNVPKRLLTTRQQLMATADDALNWGGLLGARAVVPCADGGAPWYWREGMGPKYPGFPGTPVEGASELDENPDSDPFPERLEQVRERRKRGPRALILRPGEVLEGDDISADAPFCWPFERRAPQL